MSTTQPTVEEQLQALVFKYEDGEDHDEGAFDDNCVICRILADLRAILSLRPPVEIGALVDDPVIAALEAWEVAETLASHHDARTSIDRALPLMRACETAGWDADAPPYDGFVPWAYRRKVALQAAEIERLRRAPEGEAGTLVEELTTLLTPESPMHPIGCATWEQAALYNIERAAAELTRLSAEVEGVRAWAVKLKASRDEAQGEVASLAKDCAEWKFRAQAAEAALAKAREGLKEVSDLGRFERGGVDLNEDEFGRGVRIARITAAEIADNTLASISPVKGMKTNG